MMDATYPDWDALCRLCLAENLGVDTKISIFPSDENTDHIRKLSIPVRIMTCAALEVHVTDILPKHVCTECRYQLEKSYYFRKRCQVSDGKLRKHVRLLNLGKKSTVFAGNSEDVSEDESDYNDSLQFLKEQDKLRQRQELVKQEEFKQNLKRQIKEETQKYKRILDKCIESKKEEFRRELRSELKLAQVKAEIRKEVQATCRKTEVKSLLKDLEEFLSWKQATMESDMDNNDANDGSAVNTSTNKRKISEDCVEEANDETAKQTSAKRRASSQQNHTNALTESVNVEQTATITAATTTAAATSNANASVDSEETLDVYIIESEEDEANEGDDEGEDDSEIKEVQVPNGIVKESDSQASVFNTVQCIDEDSLSDVEFVSYEKKDPSDIKDKSQSNTTTNKEDRQPSFVRHITLDEGSTTDEKKEGHMHNADPPISFKCYLCPTALPTVIELDRHMRNHERAKGRFIVHQCSGSQIYFSCRSDLIRHMDMHAELQLNEPSNVKATTTTNTGKQHTLARSSLDEKKNDTPKTFKCKLCPTIFPTEPLLVRHICEHERLKQEGLAYPCRNCRMSFACKISLQRHMMTHIKRRTLKCDYCELEFMQKASLTLHINQHHTLEPKGQQQHTCHLCPRRFNNACSLSRHIATHSTIAFQCTECDRIFEDRSAVEMHLAVARGIDTSTVRIEYRPKRQINDAEDDEENGTVDSGEVNTNFV